MSHLNLYALLIIICSLAGFLTITPSLLHWLLLAEILWVGLYVILAGWSVTFDSLNFLIWAILMFCLSTSESALGLSLLLYNTVLFNNFNGPRNMFNLPWHNNKHEILLK